MRQRESVIDFTLSQTGSLDALIPIMTLNDLDSLVFDSSVELKIMEEMISGKRVTEFFKNNGYPCTSPKILIPSPGQFSSSFNQSFS